MPSGRRRHSELDILLELHQDGIRCYQCTSKGNTLILSMELPPCLVSSMSHVKEIWKDLNICMETSAAKMIMLFDKIRNPRY
jgi:hypothetical protein